MHRLRLVVYQYVHHSVHRSVWTRTDQRHNTVFGVGMFCAISICCAASRSTWSFARDKAIPFHTVFARISHQSDKDDGSDVPLNAHLLSTTIQLLLGLIFLGSTAAFNAFIGVAVICLGASYAMPIAISLWYGRKEMADAPYALGRWGLPLNIISLLWVCFEIILFSMPAVLPVTQVTMSESQLRMSRVARSHPSLSQTMRPSCSWASQ